MQICNNDNMDMCNTKILKTTMHFQLLEKSHISLINWYNLKMIVSIKEMSLVTIMYNVLFDTKKFLA